MEKLLVIENAENMPNRLTGGLEEERCWLQEALERRGEGVERIVGQCAGMHQVLVDLQRAAPSDVPVLITGESGTGRELVARTIGSLSTRAAGPFVTINCGATPEQLLESELFGVERGADRPVPGKIECAEGGTLFLDELGRLPHQLQVRLLRFLHEGKLQRAGGKEEVEADTRVICATTTDLVHALGEGQLRDDLYYAIAVITLELPPLRARGEDIMLLAHYFLKRHAPAGNGKVVKGFTPAAISVMESHAWPGNVRELENRVQRGMVMTDAPLLKPEALGFSGTEPVRELHPPAQKLSLKEARDRVERGMICAAVDSSRGNMAKASELLGVSRPTLYDLLKKHGLFKQGAARQ